MAIEGVPLRTLDPDQFFRRLVYGKPTRAVYRFILEKTDSVGNPAISVERLIGGNYNGPMMLPPDQPVMVVTSIAMEDCELIGRSE